MKSNNYFFSLLFLALSLVSSCGSSSSAPSSTTNTSACTVTTPACTTATGASAIPTSSTQNIPVYVADAATTGSYGYDNEPLVSVTICSPNHTSASQCQVVSNILLDTASSGLRVFASALNSNVQLTQQTISTSKGVKNLAECTAFGTGADWGPIQTGDIILGNQTASNVSIQVININFAKVPDSCLSLCPDADPCDAGYNGILGVGPIVADCGADCASTDISVNPGAYFGCDSTGCYNATTGACQTGGVCAFTVSNAQQVSNPVAAFASGFNNGISIALPNVASSGAASVTGTFTLGIPSSTVGGVYTMDPNGATDGNYLDFDTTFNGIVYGYPSTNSTKAFLDTGSNGIFFPGGLTECSDSSGFYCPTSTQNLSATMAAYTGSPSVSVPFSIANAQTLVATGNSSFNNLGGATHHTFDWGLPFFFNRTVYIGIENKTATINSSTATGPYWAF